MSEVITITGRDELRSRLPDVIAAIQADADAGVSVLIKPLDEHTELQRRRLNAMCGDLAKQVRMTEAGEYVHVSECPLGQRLSKDDWRGMFMAVLHGMRSVPNPEGPGFIVLSRSSQRPSRKKFAAAIELISAFGSQRGVAWTDPQFRAWMEEAERMAA